MHLHIPMLSLSSPHLSSPPPTPPTNTKNNKPFRHLNFAAAHSDPLLAASLHAAVLKSGHLHAADLLAANSLLDAYLKCRHLHSALYLFDEMPRRDAASYTSLISGYCRLGAPGAALAVFLDMLSEEQDGQVARPNEFTAAAIVRTCALLDDERLCKIVHGYLVKNGFCGDAFVVASLVDMYAKIGAFASAKKLVLGLRRRDVFSWSALISGCVLNGMLEKAVESFAVMLENGVLPNNVTMLSIIQACSLMGEPSLFGPVHALITRLELDADDLVVNSLIQMYAKNGFVKESMQLFIDFYLMRGNVCSVPDVFAALLHGCAVLGSLKHGKEIHGHMMKMNVCPSTIIGNSLMGMYARFGQVGAANFIFESMQDKDTVSWNTMISCFVKSDRSDKALELFRALCSCGSENVPDFVTVLSSVQACSEVASLQQGQMLHHFMIKSGFDCNVWIGNALINMYARSGRIDLAEQIFEEMDVKDLGSWNSMITAYGIHGDGRSALRVFYELNNERIHEPNAITFASVISACSHSGLTCEGYECFKSMRRDHGIEPSMEHYASVVDLIGRSGRLMEAEEFIKDLPISPDLSVWGSLLGACRLHVNVEIAERAAKELSILDPTSDVWRVCLSNIYALAGRWKDSSKIRAEMKRDGLRKEAGWSFVDVRGLEHFKFVSADTRHHEADRIYEVWRSMNRHMMDVCVDVY